MLTCYSGPEPLLIMKDQLTLTFYSGPETHILGALFLDFCFDSLGVVYGFLYIISVIRTEK